MAEIGPVRPSFVLEEEPPASKKAESLIAGTKNHGMVIDVTPDGMEINAYYTGFRAEDHKYAVLREPVTIPWEELEKLRARSKKTKGKVAQLDRIESDVDEEYLATLPIVTINSRRFYIDPAKRERRAVEKPTEVWRF